jgi:hypothetical protein
MEFKIMILTGPPRGHHDPARAALPPERRHAGHIPPPHRRLTSSVSPASVLLARHHPGTPPVLTGRTLPPVNPHRAAVERVTTSVRARAPRGDHAGTRAARGPLNRGPADLPAGHAWQGVGLSTVAVGRISARHCVMF